MRAEPARMQHNNSNQLIAAVGKWLAGIDLNALNIAAQARESSGDALTFARSTR